MQTLKLSEDKVGKYLSITYLRDLSSRHTDTPGLAVTHTLYCGCGDQLRPERSACGAARPTSPCPDVKLCFATRPAMLLFISSGTFTGNKQKSGTVAEFFNSYISSRYKKTRKIFLLHGRKPGCAVIYTHFHLSCQHSPPGRSPFVKGPIFQVAIRGKCHHHCTRILRHSTQMTVSSRRRLQP